MKNSHVKTGKKIRESFVKRLVHLSKGWSICQKGGPFVKRCGPFVKRCARTLNCYTTIVPPTRFSTDGCSRSVIDLFACNWHDLVLNTEVSDPISDHCCVTVHLKVSRHIRSDPKQKHVRPDFANTDWLGLRTALSQAPLFDEVRGYPRHRQR